MASGAIHAWEQEDVTATRGEGMAGEHPFESVLMQAWNGQLGLTQLIEECGTLGQSGRAPLAAVLYQTWLNRTPSPHAHLIHFNLGAALTNLGDLAGAERAYREAIALSPGFVQPRLNLGMVLERHGQLDKAIEEWSWVAQNVPAEVAENKPFLLLALNSLGRVLEIRKQYHDALAYLTRSLELDSTQHDVIHHWVYLRQKQCCWPIYQAVGKVSRDFMVQSTSALAMIALTDDPSEQLTAARRFADKKVLKNLPTLAAPDGYGHRKLRIGYCSSDFCLHPVAMLMVELFELHNRDDFEIYGYCWSPEDGSDVRKRVIAAMNHFRRIHDLSDEQAARLIREDEIDILVDLQGQTSGARTQDRYVLNAHGFLLTRPAPARLSSCLTRRPSPADRGTARW